MRIERTAMRIKVKLMGTCSRKTGSHRRHDVHGPFHTAQRGEEGSSAERGSQATAGLSGQIHRRRWGDTICHARGACCRAPMLRPAPLSSALHALATLQARRASRRSARRSGPKQQGRAVSASWMRTTQASGPGAAQQQCPPMTREARRTMAKMVRATGFLGMLDGHPAARPCWPHACVSARRRAKSSPDCAVQMRR